MAQVCKAESSETSGRGFGEVQRGAKSEVEGQGKMEQCKLIATCFLGCLGVSIQCSMFCST